MSDIPEKNEAVMQVALLTEAIDKPFSEEGYQHFDQIREKITGRIIYLLKNNPEQLNLILYRLDINEKALSDVMMNYAPWQIPEKLTFMIIEREMQKLETRRKYRSDKKYPPDL